MATTYRVTVSCSFCSTVLEVNRGLSSAEANAYRPTQYLALPCNKHDPRGVIVNHPSLIYAVESEDTPITTPVPAGTTPRRYISASLGAVSGPSTFDAGPHKSAKLVSTFAFASRRSTFFLNTTHISRCLGFLWRLGDSTFVAYARRKARASLSMASTAAHAVFHARVRRRPTFTATSAAAHASFTARRKSRARIPAQPSATHSTATFSVRRKSRGQAAMVSGPSTCTFSATVTH